MTLNFIAVLVYMSKVKNIETPHNQTIKRNNQNWKSKRNKKTTWTSMKTRGEIRCSGRVSISCSASDTRHDVPCVVSRNETLRTFNLSDIHHPVSTQDFEFITKLNSHQIINLLKSRLSPVWVYARCCND